MNDTDEIVQELPVESSEHLDQPDRGGIAGACTADTSDASRSERLVA